tara:strand:- start:414 stop:797 length:384 start_codon:yes stop_codon:yes gene_type:complete
MLLDVKNSETGCLIPFELSSLPFIPKRFFVVSNNNAGDIRGNHAHINEEHFLICISGTVLVQKESKSGKENIYLKKGNCIHQKELEWYTITFIEKNTSLVVFANHEYTEENYIRDYGEYKKQVENKK